MQRLSFGFYRALFDELEMYETHFSQLQRDYARELGREILVFAVDFSELHDYIHLADRDARRAAINSYILNTLEDQFSILPGAVGELLTDLERVVPRHLKPDFAEVLYTYPAVVQFRSIFPEAIQDEERLIKLYANAEAELKGALGGILDVVVRGLAYTSIQALQNLLREKLTPIQGVQQIGPLSPEAKSLSRLVECHLAVSRPNLTESNQTDALDFIVALLLNQQGEPPSKRYITIYSQARSLIQACRSHDSLQWDNDYLIREAKYFQFRTKLQELFPTTVEQRHEYVVEGCQLCQKLKAEISKLIDIDEQLQEGAIEASLELIDLYRRFEEEYKHPLSFREEMGERRITREQAKRLYDTLVDEARFVGRVEDTYEVLKEHLRRIERTLQAFTPVSTDTADARAHKANLRRWLGLVDLKTEEENTQLTGGLEDDITT